MVIWHCPPQGTVERCPCCDNFSIAELGGYEICGCCGWEDDPVQSTDPTFGGGANDESLEEARNAFFAKKTVKDSPNCLAICRICGFESNEGMNICPCCGVEFGYEDTILPAIKGFREEWLAKGGQWRSEKDKPPNWSLEEQMLQIPEKFR